MFDVVPTQGQREYALWQFAKHKHIATGSGEDGDIEQQLIGFLGQTVVADLLNVPRPILGTGFDGGVDFRIYGKTIDLKVKKRTTPVQSHYACDLFDRQNYGVDYYLFASFNTKQNTLTICGMANNDTFRNAKHYSKGEQAPRDNGTGFEIKGNSTEVTVADLIQLNSVLDITKVIMWSENGSEYV